MDISKYQKIVDIIEQYAQAIRASLLYKDTENIINIKDAIKEFGGELQYTKDTRGYADIKKGKKFNFKIEIDEYIKDTDKEKFAIAHELGHLFMHMGFVFDKEKWKEFSPEQTYSIGFGEYTFLEAESDTFALALFMPRKRFMQVALKCSNGDGYSISEIADEFNVNRQWVVDRGRDLGLWD